MLVRFQNTNHGPTFKPCGYIHVSIIIYNTCIDLCSVSINNKNN